MNETRLKKDKKFSIRTNTSRVFSVDFKRSKVKELTLKQVRIKDLCELYGISRQTVYNWLYAFSPEHSKGVKLVVQMESETQKTKLLQQRVAELERVIGQKQLEIDFFERMLLIASEEVGYDIKKKYAVPPLNGFDNTQTVMPTK